MAAPEVLLQQLPSTPVAVVRRVVRQSELARVVPECCGIVWNLMRAQHAKAGRNVAIYWDGTIRLEAGVELLGPLTEADGVVRSATPHGAVATAAHLGPYASLGVAHAAIREWCVAHGYHLAGPNWEIYGHWQESWTADPAQIRTDVFYQVVRAGTSAA